jgi:cytochrome P450
LIDKNFSTEIRKLRVILSLIVVIYNFNQKTTLRQSMTTTIGIRDLARSSSVLKDFDYVSIEDKKTHKRKGLMVSDQYADEVEKYLKKIIAKKQQQDIDDIMKFAGSCTIDEKYQNMDSRELRRARALKA